MRFSQWMMGLYALACGLAVSSAVGAAEVAGPGPVPVLVAESELFEAVGRLPADGGLSIYVDRAESNAPVLAAQLEVEFAGQARVAVFRPAQGDYLIQDADWLQALRKPGEHPLMLTLVAGEESDLLPATLSVATPSGSTAARSPLAWLGLLALLLPLGWLWRRRLHKRQEGRA